MVQIKLAIHSLIHDWRRYALFTFSSALLMCINFVFLSILQNKSIRQDTFGSMISSLIQVGFIFVFVLSIIISFYANAFLMRQRYHELGIYNILGMTRFDLDLIIFWQNLVMYFVSLIIGLISGITFQELAFLVIKKILNNNKIAGSIDLFPILSVVILFFIIYLLLMIYNISKISHLSPINLLKSANKVGAEPKSHWIMGILGFILLGSGYYISVTTQPSGKVIFEFILAILLVIFGTYLLFIAGSIIVLKVLRKNKKFYYKPDHFISVSGMLFRMKQNGAGLASICLLCTSTLVVLVSVVTLFVNCQKIVDNTMPYDLRLDGNVASLTNKEQDHLESVANKYQVKLSDQHQMITSQSIPATISDGKVNTDSDYILPKSILIITTIDQYNNWQHTDKKINDNELLIYSPKYKINTNYLIFNNKKYQIQQEKDFSVQQDAQGSSIPLIYVIASNDKVVKKLNAVDNSSNGGPSKINTYVANMKGKEKNILSFTTELKPYFLKNHRILSSKIELKKQLNALFGGILFVGILIGLVMSITTALIIYYKQVSEGMADRERFSTMQRVGLSFKETKKAIRSQVLMVFMLPIIGAVINLAFAYPALKSIFKLMGMWNSETFFIVSIITTLVLLVCYVTVYLLTARTYQRIINQ